MSKVPFRHVEPGIRPIPKWTPWQNLVVHFRRLRVVGVFLFQDIQLCLRSTLHCVFRAECTNAQPLGCSMGFYCQNKSSNDCMQRYQNKTLGCNTPRQKKRFLNQCQGIRINQWSPSNVFKHSHFFYIPQKKRKKQMTFPAQPDCHQDSIGSIGQKFTGMVLGRCRPPIANREGVEILAGASGWKVGPKQEKKSANIYIYTYYTWGNTNLSHMLSY